MTHDHKRALLKLESHQGYSGSAFGRLPTIIDCDNDEREPVQSLRAMMNLIPRGKDGGIVRGPLPEDTARTAILVAMLSIAIYMSALVDLKVLALFKRRNTLYFWSLLIASWGIMSHSLGIILKWFVGSCPWQVNTAFASFGWWGMVTGQSLVLYSRLHLVLRSQRLLRGVLIMIVANFCIFQVPTTILTFGSNQADPGMWLSVYNVYERIQLIVFTLQELLISVIYIRAALKMLLPNDPGETRRTKKFLIYLNILCIILDIAFVCEVYSGEWVYKTGTQSLAYAIKLTIEFVVLNKLMDVYRLGPGACSACMRKFDSNRHNNLSVQRSGQQHHSSTTRHSSSTQGVGPAMSLGKPRGAERLGPFEEEEMVEVTNGKGTTTAHVGVDMESDAVEDKGRNIVVTTGITTWSQGMGHAD